jgi:NAD(P)-dependent dehydrogenase (short-subunit alcohol dehydrogenase family)
MSDAGKRVVVVGSSSGLGRAIGIGLAERGSQVAFLARRLDRLEKAAAEAGEGAVAIACDVTDAQAVTTAIDAAAAALGGIDAVVYSTGIGILSKVEDLTAEDWKRAFDTNVIGASLVTAAALPHLRKSQGVAMYLSSVSASLTPTWPGAAAYTVSKAALEKLVEAWNAEHGDIAFTRINVGDTAGGEGESTTEFINNWDFDFLGKVHPIWAERKLITGTLMEVDELIDVVDKVSRLGATVHVPIVVVTPRSNTQLFA